MKHRAQRGMVLLNIMDDYEVFCLIFLKNNSIVAGRLCWRIKEMTSVGKKHNNAWYPFLLLLIWMPYILHFFNKIFSCVLF